LACQPLGSVGSDTNGLNAGNDGGASDAGNPCEQGYRWVQGYCSGACDVAVACACGDGVWEDAVCPESLPAACDALCAPYGGWCPPTTGDAGGCASGADGGNPCDSPYQMFNGYCSGPCEDAIGCDCADGTEQPAICPENWQMACGVLCAPHGGWCTVGASGDGGCAADGG
jgi:hypothetical protein